MKSEEKHVARQVFDLAIPDNHNRSVGSGDFYMIAHFNRVALNQVPETTHATVMDATLAHGRVLLQQHGIVADDAVNPLSIDDRLIGGSSFATEKHCDPPIAIGRPGIDEPANGGQEIGILWVSLPTGTIDNTFARIGNLFQYRQLAATGPFMGHPRSELIVILYDRWLGMMR